MQIKGLVYETNIAMPSKDRTRRNKRKDINKCYEIKMLYSQRGRKLKYDKHLQAPYKNGKKLKF